MNVNIGEGAKNVPIGFGLSLAMNERAMENYGKMADSEREQWLTRAGSVKSKSEMEQLVDRIGEIGGLL